MNVGENHLVCLDVIIPFLGNFAFSRREGGALCVLDFVLFPALTYRHRHIHLQGRGGRATAMRVVEEQTVLLGAAERGFPTMKAPTEAREATRQKVFIFVCVPVVGGCVCVERVSGERCDK